MKKSEKIIIISGTFDPLDSEDISFIKEAKSKGDWLIVGIHSDLYMTNVGGFVQNYETRKSIIQELKMVDEILRFEDDDNTSCQLLDIVKILYTGAQIFYIPRDTTEKINEKSIRGIKLLTAKQ